MKTNATLFLAMLVAAATVNVCAQSSTTSLPEGNSEHSSTKLQRGMEFGGEFPDRVKVTITTFAVSRGGIRGGGAVTGGGALDKGHVIHRHLSTNDACYGYDLVIEPPQDRDQPLSLFRVSFLPINSEWEKQQKEKLPTTCRIISLPGLPQPQQVAEGSTILLELLSNPQTGVKIIDAIKVGWHKEDLVKQKVGKK